jgi:hypothetical protein
LIQVVEKSSKWTGRLNGERAGYLQRIDEETAMNRRLNLFAASVVLFSLLAGGAYARKAQAQPPQQYPILDRVAEKIVQKYQTSTCEQLWQKKSQKAPPSPEEQKVIQMLHNDAEMRTALINKVAAPIANKMFECGMIP